MQVKLSVPAEKRRIGLFGAAYDLLPMAQKLALKQVYVAALIQGLVPADDPPEPYDVIQRQLPDSVGGLAVVRHGSVVLPGWQRPKPQPEDFDRLQLTAVEALLQDGCGQAAVEKVQAFVSERVLPDLPIMVGVDHGQTAGVLRALAADNPTARLGVLLFDGHLDALSAAARESALLAAQGSVTGGSGTQTANIPHATKSENGHRTQQGGGAAIYHCQSFLLDLLDEGTIAPQNLIVAGVYRKPSADLHERLGEGVAAYLQEYDALLARGVQVLERDELEADPSCLDQALERLQIDDLYLSLDLDVCASERVPAVRFHDSVGMTPESLFELAKRVRCFVDRRQLALAGLDLMEIDIHLLHLDDSDATVATAIGFLGTMLGSV